MIRAALPARPDPVEAAVAEAIRDFLAGRFAVDGRRTRIAVGFSGGGDSMLLLDVVAALAPRLGFDACAVHVDHGLSPQADRWVAFCAEACARRCLPLAVVRVAVAREPQASVEASARAARYAAFAAQDVDAVALGHHADDQAETLLLQLLRGAGPPGLAAMATQRSPGYGPALLRPLLRLPRTTLRAAATSRGLDWIDDESNADTRLRRNWLRSEIAPRLASTFPGYPETLLRAAAHQADAARLADDLAALDAQGALAFDAVDGPMLDQARLVSIAALGEHRARNLLRWYLARHGLPAPSSSRLEAMLRQLTRSSADARVRLAHAGVEIGLHRQRIVVHAPALPWPARRWRGEPEFELPQGRLRFTPVCGAGLAADRARADGVAIRCRAGGERLRPGPGRPRRRVTHLFQEHGVPPWQRDVWPLIFIGEALAAVPGIGIDPAFGAIGAGVAVAWLPHERQSLIRVNLDAQAAG